jgi:multiple sugar transport system permease protein
VFVVCAVILSPCFVMFTTALIPISSNMFKPITVGINIFYGFNFIKWQYLFATSIFTTIPVVVLFLCIEKHLAAGLTSGGVKG